MYGFEMILYYERAIKDILENRFLNIVSIITIALSVFIVSVFGLLFLNVSDMMNAWEKGVRIMAYLTPDITKESLLEIEKKINGMYGVAEARFISKTEALALLKDQLKRQSSLLSDLKENPLPDAFEIRMRATSKSSETIEELAIRLESIPVVDEVEYGQQWLGRFSNLFNFFRIAGYAIGCLFFMATVFIIANTIRLVLYLRREEIEIMRLVGATDNFIKIPFYIQGLIQGALGGIIGLVALSIAFVLISSNIDHGFSPSFFHIRFFSVKVCFSILLCSMFIGWIGCYLSLKQFLKV